VFIRVHSWLFLNAGAVWVRLVGARVRGQPEPEEKQQEDDHDQREVDPQMGFVCVRIYSWGHDRQRGDGQGYNLVLANSNEGPWMNLVRPRSEQIRLTKSIQFPQLSGDLRSSSLQLAIND
jgi:hypothetical protein